MSSENMALVSHPEYEGSREDKEGIKKPDLALVANDLSHWFVVEVELLSHSLDGHVLPQMRCLKYGEPQLGCVEIISN